MTTRRLTFLLTAGTLCLAAPALAADSTSLANIATTQQVPFQAGGTIYLNHSFGELLIQGWDRPDVEIEVTKTPDELYTAKDQAAANKLADNVKVTATRRSPGELVIATTVGHFSRWRHPFSETADLMMVYRIRVPRDSKLVIRHGDGDVLVSDMLSDIDATCHSGDIAVLLPENGQYAIDALSHVGTLSSDFEGNFHHGLWSSDFSSKAPAAAAHHVHLRTGFGGIEIKGQPVAALAPASVTR
jgi:hypothetical protein